MNRPNSILVVVERAQEASGPIEKALVIARQFGARIELFLCESEQAYELARAYDREGIEQARAQSVARARDYLLDLKTHANAPEVEVAIDAACESPFYEAVVRKVLRSKPDLVIKGLVAGHRADPNDWQLMRTCPATLMLVRRMTWHMPPRVAAAVDVSDQETVSLPRDVMQTARMLASPWQASLHVMYGENSASMAAAASRAERLRGLCEAAGVTADRTHLLYGPAEDSLPKFVRQQGYDVLILGALTHRPASTALVGTLTARLFDALDCDFVVVKPSSYRSPIGDRPEEGVHPAPGQRGSPTASH